MHKRLLVSIATGVLAAGAGLGVSPAKASHCSSPLALNTGTGATTPSPVPQNSVLLTHPSAHPFPACSVPQDAVDTRRIPPGTTHVAPSFIADYGAGVPTLYAYLSGSGFNEARVDLHRTVITGGAIYAGGWATLPSGPTTINAVISVRLVNPANGATVAAGTWRATT